MTAIVYLGLFAGILGAWYGFRRAGVKTADGLPSKFWLRAAGALIGGLLIDLANTFFNEMVGTMLSKNAAPLSDHPFFFALFATGALVTAFSEWGCFGYLVGLLNARWPDKAKAPVAASEEKAAS
jgi:hypothetical protein